MHAGMRACMRTFVLVAGGVAANAAPQAEGAHPLRQQRAVQHGSGPPGVVFRRRGPYRVEPGRHRRLSHTPHPPGCASAPPCFFCRRVEEKLWMKFRPTFSPGFLRTRSDPTEHPFPALSSKIFPVCWHGDLCHGPHAPNVYIIETKKASQNTRTVKLFLSDLLLMSQFENSNFGALVMGKFWCSFS